MNISEALAVIDEMVASANETLDTDPKNKAFKKETLANLALIENVIGIGGKDPYGYFQLGVDPGLKEKVETLISERNKVKKNRDFPRADAIRDELNDLGIAIMDTANGTLWEKK
jgi:cysteinyl-tRNA synthetase